MNLYPKMILAAEVFVTLLLTSAPALMLLGELTLRGA